MTTDCTSKHRCGHCRLDDLANARTNAKLAREASSILVGERVCSDCHLLKPLDQFRPKRFRCHDCVRRFRAEALIAHPRKYYAKKKFPCRLACGREVGEEGRSCWPCYVAERRANMVEKPKPIRPPRIPAAPKPERFCTAGCGRTVSASTDLCAGCRKAKQINIAANAERQIKTRRVTESLTTGSALGFLWVGEEALLLNYRCINPLCKKPIIVHGKCYKCATGVEKTLKCLPMIEYAAEKQLAS